MCSHVLLFYFGEEVHSLYQHKGWFLDVRGEALCGYDSTTASNPGETWVLLTHFSAVLVGGGNTV